MNTKKSTAKGKLRFEINPVCAECMKCKATCGNGTACQSVRKKLRAYNGVRPTADGFDCALPLSIDSHTVCSFGCLYCNIAGTKIWLADGTFKDIEKIIPGDIVIGFEQIANKNRHFAYSKVEEVFSRKAPVIKIKTASGKIITCTKDHPWYTGRIEAKYMYEPAKVGRPLMFVIEPRTKSEITTDYKKGYIRGLIEGDGTIVDKVYTNAKRSRHIKNVRIAMKDEPPLNRFVDFVKDLELKAYKGIFTYKGGKLPCVRLYGDDALNLAYKNNPLNNDEYWRGWLAGIFDAEGSTHKVLRIAQYPHIHPKIYNSIKKGLSRFSFKFVEEKSAVRMKGGRHEVMRFWALTQPTLWRKVEKVIIGQRLLPQKDQIVSITELGEAQVYSLKTSTHNYIANGYVSRNCFTPNLIQGREKTLKPVGQTSLNFIEGIFSGRKGKTYERFRKILKYDQRNANGYPCPVQCGALADPFDNIERNQGWTLKFIELCKKYNQPCRFSTKGNLFLVDEYINAMKEKPHLFWVAFSIISADDEIIKQIDKRAPPTSERIECMRRLSAIGVKTSLRFRPMIPGISDSTKNHPHAWRDLIDMAADAGAVAISLETVFLPGSMTKDLKKRWEEIERISGKPLIKIYKSFGKNQSCIRPSHQWTEEIVHKVVEYAKKKGLAIGVSSPDWKQLNDYGCCCGISPDDPVFGNWQRENATNALVMARDGKIEEISSKEIIPAWAYTFPLAGVVNLGVGPKTAFNKRHLKWSDKLKEVWDNPERERSPLIYFQGALKPIRKDENGVIYKYEGLKRRFKDKTPYWKVE